MAPKRKPIPEPEALSVSEEEETSSEGEETVAEDEPAASSDEELDKPITSSHPLSADSESDSESDPEPDNKKSKSTVMPIASKPMDNTKPTPSKRGSSQMEPAQKESKRSKSKNKGVEQSSGSKKKIMDAVRTPFQRLWCETDELSLLEGLINFRDEKGTDPLKNLESFLEYIKKNLMVDVSQSQLKDKVFKLRRKYHQMKGEQISKPHDRQIYDLCDRLWGSTMQNGTIKSNGKAGGSVSKKEKLKALKRDLGMDMDMEEDDGGDKMEMEVDVKRNLELKDMAKVTRFAAMEEYVVNNGLNSVRAEERANMEEKWKGLYKESLEWFIKRNELLNEQTKLMLGGR